MSNGDYREKIEEHRQSIELEEQQSSRMSRSRKTGKKKKKTRKNPLLNILLVVLLGIPFSLLIYVSFFYNPTVTETAAIEQNGSVVEVQTNDTFSSSDKQKEEPKIEEIDSESTSNSQDSKEEAEKQAEIEAAKAEQAKLEEQEQQQGNSKTHTVQANENLFRIALKYYNDANGVDKIIEANNLPSNSISVGQTLIIP